MNGTVRAELTKLMAVKFQLPSQKQVVFSKFKQAFDEFGGDYNEIYNKLQLKKKDLYHNLATSKEGEEFLPREGYVTVVKQEVVDKKTLAYEKKMQSIKEEFDEKREKLLVRHHSGAESDKELFEAANRAFDKEIERYSKDKKKNADKIIEIEKNRESLALEIKPLDEASFKREMESLEGMYTRDKIEARDKFRKDLGKTTIQGAYELFDELEKIMSFKDVNLSASKQFSDGEVVSLESFVTTPNQANPEEEMVIRGSFVRNLEKFMSGFDSLEPKTAKVLKMHLGLDESNDPYVHGLWGVPMEKITEIVESLPKNFYPRMDLVDGDFKKRMDTWKAKKPQKVMTIKRTPADINKQKNALKVWNRKRKVAANDISAALHFLAGRGSWKGTKSKKVSMIKKFGMSYAKPKKLNNSQKQKVKDFFYQLNGAKVSSKPTNLKTKNRTLSDKELKALTRLHNKNKPTETLGSEAVYKRVKRDLELGKLALREIIPIKVKRDLMHNYSDMRAYNIRKGHVTEDLRKSMVVDKFFGCKMTFRTKEDSIITKAYDKIRSITNYLFGK
jgi:hypothetical protein